MSSRNERRLNRKSWGKAILDHPAMKRMQRNARRAGRAALEVYRMDGATPAEHVYFDVFSMREWSTENLDVVGVPMNWERAEGLIEGGSVDRQRIAEHTIQTDRRPIIVGRDAAGDGNDQILDGAHTYVAMALGATAAGQAGQPILVTAYVLEPAQWRRFVIPTHIAKALNFDAKFDEDDRAWATPADDWAAHFDA